MKHRSALRRSVLFGGQRALFISTGLSRGPVACCPKAFGMTTRESELKLPNIIALNPEEVIIPAEAERLIAEIKGLGLGIKVHKFPYGKVGEIGGSLRCNTHPIYRD